MLAMDSNRLLVAGLGPCGGMVSRYDYAVIMGCGRQQGLRRSIKFISYWAKSNMIVKRKHPCAYW
jgi:hypothetical protein